MPRQLDLNLLRAFVAVADAGGVTRAAGFLNLTQSAVSMQIKRLEESLGLNLLERSGRGVSLTASGEQLLGYARRMLEVNDDCLARLTHQAFEGEITLGVPSDIVYPAIPQVLHRFAAEFPRVRVQLISSFTRELKEMFTRGAADIILTTEDACDPGCETLIERRLCWIGAPGGTAWRRRPVPLALENSCIFRGRMQRALDRAGIPWIMAVESESSRSIEASVSADLAIHALIEGAEPHQLEPIAHGGALPDLGTTRINMYVGEPAQRQVVGALAEMIRCAFRARAAPARPVMVQAS
jgi:DNA-binding transcriptional LysR family regulator